MRTIHEAQPLTVTHDGDPTGLFDAARMGQVISNLMGNAIQYSDGSGPVTVTISGDDPDALRVSVHNFGDPIPAKSQKTIFQSWMRGNVQDMDETLASRIGPIHREADRGGPRRGHHG